MELSVFAPEATSVLLTTTAGDRELTRSSDRWIGDVENGERYGLVVTGPAGSRFSPDRTLVDPQATTVWFHDEHRRDAARPDAGPNHRIAPMAVAVRWPEPQRPQWTTRPLMIHEVHVRGMTRLREVDDAGTFRALIDELPRLRTLGVSVLELLPVHQFDPDEGNYWGYMPLVFGAVHRQYAAGEDANLEIRELIAAAHDHDIEVWLDVVFNHTTEEDELGPTYNLRGLADPHWYALHDDDSYVDEAGCGNIIDTHSEVARELIMMSLDRFADLGVDGFRFDLATVLGRNPDFVRSIGDWAQGRGVRLVAEAWDLARYQVGRAWPDPRWMQWNGKYRDDVRGFLRGEGGLVAAMMRRLQGSPDLFDEPAHSVNYLTAHDGFTMFDLVAYDRKHNDANGWNGTDGTDDNRSWNCGWEGEAGAPDGVRVLRRRQLRNAWTLLMLSHGTPMVVAGDEFARTQGGNNNPYNQDNETTWTDWSRREDWIELERFVQRLTEFRAAQPVLVQQDWWADDVEWFGVSDGLDCGDHSRSVAWHLLGVYVMANMWWEPLVFDIQAPGEWSIVLDTSEESGFVEPTAAGPTVTVGPRSIVVLTTPVP